MQDPRSGSTLELVVNEQQMHNMSQVDLRPSSTDGNQQTTARLNNYLAQSASAQQLQQQHAESSTGVFSFEDVKSWPCRLRGNIRSKLDEAKANSETQSEYILKVFKAFSGIVIWILCFLCTIVIPVILFFIGLMNLDDCADRPSLPYLVFGVGFFMTASNLFNLALSLNIPILANHKFLTTDIKNIIASILNILFNCIVVLFYILAAYMVYNIRGGRRNGEGNDQIESNVEGESSKADREIRCDATLYNFTFWFTTLILGSLAVMSFFATILFVYNRYRLAIIRGSTPRSHQTTTTNSPTRAENGLSQSSNTDASNRL